ncbi:MAG: AsnC family transcriptional regulator [Synergistes jonesii]|uniref:Lrp/AsnC family transcriptional regulator n=1 Tax=Synergistes jonesii TaxID=2754 RepID=UPI002A75D01F|nr:AsnC family transcriptional regulator [Synergistes jonesii]MDY2985466.1 AsnC family transcriptional regulator [Synergistes jonesii]
MQTPDETNVKILEELFGNARATFTEIGRKVGLTGTAVRDRVRQMEEDEIICGYRPVINYANIGYPIRALVIIRQNPARPVSEEQCHRVISISGGIARTYEVTGETDFIVEAVFKSMEDIKKMLMDFVKIDLITVTYIVLSTSESMPRLIRKK